MFEANLLLGRCLQNLGNPEAAVPLLEATEFFDAESEMRRDVIWYRCLPR